MVFLVLAVEDSALSPLEVAWTSAVRPRSGGEAPGGAAVASRDDAHRSWDELDASVLRRAKSGDRDAFVRLMDHYDRRLRSLAYRLLDDRESAVEAMQDVYVKAFAGLPGFQERSSVGTWLYRITYTTCLDYLRRGGRVTLTMDGEVPIDERAPDEDPSDALSDTHAVVEILHSLPPEQRATILLVGVEGFEYAEAADILDVPVGTVASRMAAARTKLRKALEERRRHRDETGRVRES